MGKSPQKKVREKFIIMHLAGPVISRNNMTRLAKFEHANASMRYRTI
jgi:hypothetical protein